MAIRLLIVEDHRLVREGLVRLLSGHPAIEVVDAAGTGAEALRALEQTCVDVVLLDIGLPDVNGLHLLPEIRRRCPDTRTLVLTMHAEAEYADEAIKHGARGMIAKSAPPEAVIEAIRAVHHGALLARQTGLTTRERQVLARIAEGASNEQIAAECGLQIKTIEGYCQRLMDKLGIHTRAGLIAHARRVRF